MTLATTRLQNGFCFFYHRRGKHSNKSQPPSTEATNSAANIGKSSSPESSSSNNNTQSEESPTISNNKESTSAPPTYESSINVVRTVNTVEDFWGTYDYLVRPNDLPNPTDYHFFREGIKPTWEDPGNCRGGKWIVRVRKGLASRYWEETLLALIGGQFPDEGEICGAVVSIRYSEDIVSIWNKSADDRQVTERIRDAMKKILHLPNSVHMEYKPHQASLMDKSSFRNTTVWKSKISERENSSSSGHSGVDRSSSNSGPPRRSNSWGEREKGKRDIDRSWR